MEHVSNLPKDSSWFIQKVDKSELLSRVSILMLELKRYTRYLGWTHVRLCDFEYVSM